MTLLEFARGPALQWSIFIFIAGVLWRLLGVLLLRSKKDLSEPRNAAAWKGLRLIGLRGRVARPWRHRRTRSASR